MITYGQNHIRLSDDEIESINNHFAYKSTNRSIFKKATVGDFIAQGGQVLVYNLDTPDTSEKYVLKIFFNYNNQAEVTSRYSKIIDASACLVENGCTELICKIEWHFITEDKNRLYCLVEKRRICLKEHQNTVTRDKYPEIAIRVAVDVLELLCHCQKNKLIHRDIKAENLFLKGNGLSSGICLGDFGTVTHIDEKGGTTTQNLRGTLSTTAPEWFALGAACETNSEPSADFDDISKSDMYSLAATVYYYLNNEEYPFSDTRNRLMGEDKSCPPPQNGSKQLKAIVVKALSLYPKDRFGSYEEMLEEIKKTTEYESYIKTTSLLNRVNKQPVVKKSYETLILGNGDTYYGTVVFGKMHGHGTICCSNGEVYIGEFSNNKRHGKGILVCKDDVYIGSFADDKRSGVGVYVYKNDPNHNYNVYIGEISDGYPHVKGTVINTDNGICCYSGEFNYGNRHGKGLVIYPSGKVKLGIFTDNQQQDIASFFFNRSLRNYFNIKKTNRRGVYYKTINDEESGMLIDIRKSAFDSVKIGRFNNNKHSLLNGIKIINNTIYIGADSIDSQKGHIEIHTDRNNCCVSVYDKAPRFFDTCHTIRIKPSKSIFLGNSNDLEEHGTCLVDLWNKSIKLLGKDSHSLIESCMTTHLEELPILENVLETFFSNDTFPSVQKQDLFSPFA